MADLSNVDTQKILQTVGQMENIVNRMSNCVNKFSEAIAALDKGWISEVKGDFMASYRTDYDAMQEMLGQLTEINSTLRDEANDFDKTESEIFSSVRALK